MNVAIIPARGGSKRIPRKNIKPLAGRPIISIVVENLLSSNCFDQVLVSTEDEEIASIASTAGAMVPFKRPEALACDHTPTLDVIKHAIECMNGRALPDQICCVYPTAALVDRSSIKVSSQIAFGNRLGFTFSALEFPHPIQRAMSISDDNKVYPLEPESLGKRTQDLAIRVHDAGQFYWATTETWQSATDILGNTNNQAVVLRGHEAVDVDNLSDWDLLETLYARQNRRMDSCVS